MKIAFTIVFRILMWLSAVTGLSYNGINILVYYLLIPLVLLVLLDRIIKKFVCTPLLILVWISILFFVGNFSRFSDRAFDASVVFLNSFGFIGWNYVVASVIICVVLPAIAFAITCYFAFPRLFKRKPKLTTPFTAQ